MSITIPQVNMFGEILETRNLIEPQDLICLLITKDKKAAWDWAMSHPNDLPPVQLFLGVMNEAIRVDRAVWRDAMENVLQDRRKAWWDAQQDGRSDVDFLLGRIAGVHYWRLGHRWAEFCQHEGQGIFVLPMACVTLLAADPSCPDEILEFILKAPVSNVFEICGESDATFKPESEWGDYARREQPNVVHEQTGEAFTPGGSDAPAEVGGERDQQLPA